MALDHSTAIFSCWSCDTGCFCWSCWCLIHFSPLTSSNSSHPAQVSAACLSASQVLGPKPHHVVCNSMHNHAVRAIVLFFCFIKGICFHFGVLSNICIHCLGLIPLQNFWQTTIWNSALLWAYGGHLLRPSHNSFIHSGGLFCYFSFFICLL